jgi:hypothetical protein
LGDTLSPERYHSIEIEISDPCSSFLQNLPGGSNLVNSISCTKCAAARSGNFGLGFLHARNLQGTYRAIRQQPAPMTASDITS